MFLGAYHYSGVRTDLLAGYYRLSSAVPASSLDLHVCVRTPSGLVVLDACPSAEAFASFSVGAEFVRLNAAAGLPRPRIEPLGEVERAMLRTPVDLGVVVP